MEKEQLPSNINFHSFEILQAITGQPEEPTKKKKSSETEKNPAAVALGRLGGLKGGKARAASLTPAQRKAIAKKAAKSRWG